VSAQTGIECRLVDGGRAGPSEEVFVRHML
jgi:hypothetical protein